MGDPYVPEADVGGGADPAERQRVAAVLGLEVHCEQVRVWFTIRATDWFLGCVNPAF